MGRAFRCEPYRAVKLPIPEIVLLFVIMLLIAAGGPRLLALLAAHRDFGTALLVAAFLAAAFAIRRAYRADSPTARADVTKGVAYAAAALLAVVTIDWNPHWAIRACLVAAECAIGFDIVTVVARARAGEG